MGKKLLLIPLWILLFIPATLLGQCPGSVSITNNTGNTICENTSVTFTATPNGGTGTFSFQWQINGNNVGPNSNSFTTSSLNNADKVKVIVTTDADASCSTSSSQITMTVNSNKTPTVNISSSPSLKCVGEMVNFTASNTNAGNSPIYEWYINSESTPSQSTSSNSFSTNTLGIGSNNIRVVLTSSLTCVTTPVAEATININIIDDAIINDPANKDQSDLCLNNPIDPILFVISGSGNGASVSGLPPGVTGTYNNGNFTISGSPTTDGTFNYTVTANGSCDSVSETGSLTVVKDAIINLTSSNSQQEVCQNEVIANITYNIGETGTGANTTGLPNGISGNFSGGVYTISGSSSQVGSHPYTITATGTCGNSETLNGTITINENLEPSVSISSSDSDNIICDETEVTFTAVPVNGGSNPSYQWLVDGINAGTNSPTFSTTTLANGESVSVIMTSSETCLSQPSATSNEITFTVNPNLTPQVNVSSSDTNICEGDSITFTANPINGGTAPSYQWKIDGTNVGNNSPTYTTNNLSSGQNVTVVLTSNEPCLATPTAISDPLNVVVNPNLTPEVSITSNDANNIICSGAPITFNAIPVNGGSNPSYQWYIDGNPQGSGGASFTTSSLLDGQTVKVIMTSNEDCLAITSAESNEISIQVDEDISNTTPAFDTTDPSINSTSVCPVASGLVYRVQEIPGATSYNWTFPAGWNITAGAGTREVIVTASTSAQSGTISVTANSECGNSNTFISENITTGTVVYVNAGPDQTVCRGTTQITLAGEIGGVITKHQHWDWSASVAGGTFSNGGNSLNGTYTLPSSIANSGGQISIKITSIDPAGPCGPKEDEMVLTVLKNATISTPSNKDQSVCINNAINDISFTITDAGTGANATGLPAGLTGIYESGIFTISGTPTESGTFNYTVNSTGSCATQQTTISGIINVNPDQTIDDPTNKSQEICINTSIEDIVFGTNSSVTNVTVTGLPAGLTGNYSSGSFIISGVATEAGSFDYTVTTTGDCLNTSQSGNITIKPDPTVDSPTNKNQELCINTALENIQFSISSPATSADVTGLPAGVTGSFNNGILTISGTPSVAGTFDYTVSTLGECINTSESGQIIVNPDPTAEINYSGDLCISQSGAIPVSLTGTGSFEGGNYFSTPDGLSLDPNTGEIMPGNSLAGTYTVNYETPVGCQTATASTTVVINELPSVDISYSGQFCTSDNTQQPVNFTNGIGAYTGGSFSATPGGLDLDPASGSINPSTSSPSSNPYTVFYTIPPTLGCDEVTVQTQVTITQLPQVSISYPTPLCTTDTTYYDVTYSSTAGDYLGGTFSGTEGLDIDSQGRINAGNSTSGIHTITYTVDTQDDGCSLVETTTQVEIFEKIQITTQPVNFGTCASNAAFFEVIATGDNLAYQWYKKDSGGSFIQLNGETNPVLSFNNATSADAGDYQVVVSSNNGICASSTSDTVTLNIDEEITITKPAEDITICEDDYQSLSFEYEAHANGATLMFQWIKDGNPISETAGKYSMTESGPVGSEGVYTGTLTIENIDISDDGVYWVEIDGPDYFNCSAATSKTFTFRVNPRPAPPVTTNIEYCLNDTAIALTASKDSNDNDLLWYSYDETTSVYTYLGTSVIPLTDTVGETSYWVSQIQPNGCESDPAELKVLVNDKPNPLATETIEFKYCFNETITGPVSVTPDAGSSVNWYDAQDATTPLSSAPTPNTSIAQLTSYWVSQTSSSTGCESDRTKVDIIINPLPEIEINLVDGYLSNICLNTETRLIASGATSYTWYFEGVEIGNGNEITINGDNVGNFDYEVIGTDDNGCTNSDIITINVEEPSVGGTTAGPTSVCITQNVGTISLTGFTGEILRWESSTDQINWTEIVETTDTLNFQNISSTTSFRAVVKNGVCDEVTSSSLTVTLDPEPMAGGVLFNGTDRVFMMCEFPTSEFLVPLQLSGTYVGEIVAWQYRRNSATEWATIMENGSNFTGNSLTGTQVNEAANNESTIFRVEVQSGACQPNVYSDYATLSIIPSDIAPSPVQITPGEVCLGEIVTMSSSTGYGGSGTFQGGAFDNSSIANHGWRVMRYGNGDFTEYTFESAADNTRPERWMRTNPHDYQMDDPNNPGNIIWQRFDSCSCDAGNKGFAIVSGDNPSTLETPVFNLYTMENPTLTFDQAYNLTAQDVIRVELSLDGGNNYDIVLMEIAGPTVSSNYAFFGDDGLGEPNNMEIDLSNWAGLSNLRVRWLYDGTTGGIYTIDDIGLPEDPQNVQLIWYYDEDINDPNNALEQIGEINQSTVTYPQDGAQWPKIGWNDFEVQTALVFDTNGDPCQSAENSAVASVYVFDNYTSEAFSNVGACGNNDVQLSATITGAFQGPITQFPEGEGSTVTWEVITAPAGYTFSENHFINEDANLSPLNDPNAVFLPPVEGNYTLRWTITPNASQTTRNILGEMVTQDISANPCPMTHIDTSFEFIDCTTLDFDGDDDYIDLGNNYNGNHFIEAWIRPFDRPLDDGSGNTNASNGVIFSSAGMEIRMEELTGITKNGRWYHIAVANNGDLWIDGISAGNIDVSGSGISNTSIGARYDANTKTTSNHFSGWIEELRIWNTAPSQDEIRFMMNQRIQIVDNPSSNTPIEGEVVPNRSVAGSYLVDGNGNNLHSKGYDINNNEILVPFYNQKWGDLAGYYRLYSDEPDPANLLPGYFDNALEPANGYTPDHSINKVPGRLYNITTNQQNTSPTPYFDDITKNGQDWETDNTWARPDVWDPPNSTGIGGVPIDWNIARINTNINSSNRNISMLGLLSETLDKELTIESDQFIRISHYLLLDGNMDLVSESQLLQDHGSILAEQSQGWLERDQQGRMSSYNYNYWTSPVSVQGAPNNSGFILEDVLWDGTDVNDPKAINFVLNYFAADGVKTNPITISSMWIWNFLGGQADIYGDWTHLSHNGTGPSGTGYSMKGTDGTVALDQYKQNYIFKGKPHNGTIQLSIGQNQNYLIGNPYASALDAWEFMLDNLPSTVTSPDGKPGRNTGPQAFNGALYYWDHFAGSTHILEEYIGGYAYYSFGGNTPAYSSDWRIDNSSPGATSGRLAKRYIPVAQGFFINSSGGYSGTFKFQNNQRAFVEDNNPGDPSIFLVHQESLKTNDLVNQKASLNGNLKGDERAKIRVKFQSPGGYHRQILVTRDAGTTNGFDLGYDAPLIENNKEDMYWLIDDSRYIIQGVPHFEKDQVLPLAIKTKAEGRFVIKIDSTENWPTEKKVYLKDKELDSIHDILIEPYIGMSAEGENKERFEIVFHNPDDEVATTDPDPIDPDPTIEPEPTNPDDLPIIDGLVGISYSHFTRQVKISNFDLLEVNKVMIFDMNGKLIQEFDGLPTQAEILLSLRPVRSGVYIVKAFCENGVCNKKIVIK